MFPETSYGDTLTLLNREFDDTMQSIEETSNHLDNLYRIKHLVDSHSYDENGKKIDMYVKENWDKVVVNDY